MMGPFCPEQGTPSHEIVMDLALTDEIVILLTGALGAVDNIIIVNMRNWECIYIYIL